jgi:two-component system response regulator RegX3
VVSAATDAPSALRELSHDSYHVVLVDAGSHSTSGSEICRAIRDVADIPICLVSPSDDEIDVVLALELGADAFMLKPVRPHELVARLLALVRRTSPRSATAGAISAGDVEIDPDLHEVRVRGELVDLTVKEFSLLSLLLAHAGRALTREFLVDRIWGTADRGTFKTLSSHVHRLREIIEPDPDNPSRLLTIRGYGYRFIPTV